MLWKHKWPEAKRLLLIALDLLSGLGRNRTILDPHFTSTAGRSPVWSVRLPVPWAAESKAAQSPWLRKVSRWQMKCRWEEENLGGQFLGSQEELQSASFHFPSSPAVIKTWHPGKVGKLLTVCVSSSVECRRSEFAALTRKAMAAQRVQGSSGQDVKDSS